MTTTSDAHFDGPGLGHKLKEEFKPKNLFPSLITGSVTSILTVIESVSYAVLIFSGALSENISAGLSVALIAAAATGIVISLMSSYPGTIAVPQNKIAPILAVMAAAIVAGMPEGSGADQAFLTVIATIVICSISTGILLTILGTFKLGGLIRFDTLPCYRRVFGRHWLALAARINQSYDRNTCHLRYFAVFL